MAVQVEPLPSFAGSDRAEAHIYPAEHYEIAHCGYRDPNWPATRSYDPEQPICERCWSDHLTSGRRLKVA